MRTIDPNDAQRPATALRIAAYLLLPFLLTGCVENASTVFDANGPGAARINSLWWLMFGVGALVYVAVMAYLFLALLRRRPPEEEALTPREGSNIVLWGGAIVPGLILVGIFGATVFTLRAVSQPDPAEIPEELTIDVIGHRFWFEVVYPELQFTTANEIHIPVNQPVRVRVTSDDVIHSFWVPELQGKLDMIPGRVNEFWIEAENTGTYQGECTEYCGIQHAKMRFLVIAREQDEFVAWVEQQQQPAPEPVDPLVQEGQQIFLGSSCVYCHYVEGTNASGRLGPDLTHVASRRTLGAGTVPNTRGNLAGWILNPQGIKPGNLMPPTQLTGPELQALLAYLESLE